jgi:hypothetical protein
VTRLLIRPSVDSRTVAAMHTLRHGLAGLRNLPYHSREEHPRKQVVLTLCWWPMCLRLR